ncbi:hypothetical protein [Rhodococcus sp. NPDC127528]|uniref:hypothetical protein n=1 Tax=unclassified Rhodococcus (in: high G+C Gram-positive bacteria) TaxID=192944 RepID=UPI00363B38D8
MLKSRKSIARLGAVAGFAALALITHPAVGSAAVTGTATVTTNDNVIVVKLAGVASPTLTGCAVQVTEAGGNGVAGGFVLPTGNPGDGVYATQRLANGTYTVYAFCLDGGGSTFLTPAAGQSVTLDADRASGGGSSIGSVTFQGGSVDRIFGS